MSIILSFSQVHIFSNFFDYLDKENEPPATNQQNEPIQPSNPVIDDLRKQSGMLVNY